MIFLFLLAGCDKPQEQALAKCEAQAESVYPSTTASQKADQLVRLCMKGSGFAWELGDDRCSSFPLERDPYCYVPDNPFSLWIYRTFLRHGSN